MISLIKRELVALENIHNINVVYACEGGSRNWGTNSTESDYDVRFIYVHPMHYYLTIDNPKHDVIDVTLSDNLGFSGWDLRKTLRLLSDSNPSIYEWLSSEERYIENQYIMKEMRRLSICFFSKKKIFHHYYHMAKKNYEKITRRKTKELKDYLNVIRPLIILLRIEKKGSFPLS